MRWHFGWGGPCFWWATNRLCTRLCPRSASRWNRLRLLTILACQISHVCPALCTAFRQKSCRSLWASNTLRPIAPECPEGWTELYCKKSVSNIIRISEKTIGFHSCFLKNSENFLNFSKSSKKFEKLLNFLGFSKIFQDFQVFFYIFKIFLNFLEHSKQIKKIQKSIRKY